MIGFVLLTMGGILSCGEPVRRQVAYWRWTASLRRAHPLPAPSTSLDELMRQAGDALDRLP